MLLTQVSDRQPLLKDGVFLVFKDTAVEICDRNGGFSLAIDSETKPEIEQLLQLLQHGGMSLEEFSQNCQTIKEEIPELLAVLGDRGFLAETPRKSQVLTGQQFYRELCRFLSRLKGQFPPSAFSQKMADGTISVNQLIGYALESYHVTHLCPRLLAPSLAHYESKVTRQLLQDFYVSELHHDRLLEKSLESINITAEQLPMMQPLPMTFAVCSSLGVFARKHPLSFKAALMLFEEDDQEFHRLFQQQCQVFKLPEKFYRPILLHAQINEEGNHEAITAALMSEVPYVSPEEQLVVKKNMINLMELMVLRTQEILDYYGNSHSLIPRCFG
ncbi:MAG: hypothetical protein Tsb0014_32210 [Pleurocapsa sp.]